MDNQDYIEEKAQEELNIKAQKLVLIEKLRAMGFSEEEIEYNFSKSDRALSFTLKDKEE